ncbi:hypothetical protein [Antarcticirhabdus aurantiaca]|nr:hypothetical protein [Antarcticirhabdus aurantiaca]
MAILKEIASLAAVIALVASFSVLGDRSTSAPAGGDVVMLVSAAR